MVTAEDASNATVTGYAGTVHFTSSDGQALLPGDATLVNGSGIFTGTLKTAGSQTLSATDTANAGVTGSGTILVTATAVTHFGVIAPTTTTAGNVFTYTVIAEDALNNTVSNYSGTVHFTSSDPQANLPADSKLTSGNGVFGATLKTAGNQTIKAADTVTSSITGLSGNILVSAASVSHFGVVASPSVITPSSTVSVTVTAEDGFNNIVASYSGIVHFTSSDPAATLPANSTLVNGIGTFSATLQTVGSQTLTATDTVNSALAGASNAILVTTSTTQATHFIVTAPSTAAAGTGFAFTVTAETVFNATATTYTGTVHFTTSDKATGVVLSADGTLVSGVGVFSATLDTAGNQFLTATDTAASSITGTSNAVNITAVAATHFAVTAPANGTEGVGLTFTVTAEDQFNNLDPTYAGIAHFTSSDAGAALPTDSSLTSGTGSFVAIFSTTGLQTLTATDTVTASITGASNAINIGVAANHFIVTAPANATAGTPITFTVTAADASNTTAIGYTGTVHFTSTDGQAVLPADVALTNGTGTFTATLKTAGTQTIKATDTVTSSLTGTSNSIVVSAAASTHIVVSAPTTATAGAAITFTVTAEDPFNNVQTGYTGTLHFTSSDSAATLPANSVLTNGTGTFTATLKTTGSQTITATDTVTSSITGASNTIAVTTAAATHFVVTAPSRWTTGAAFTYTVIAEDQFNNKTPSYSGTVHFTTSDGAAGVVIPANSTLTNGSGTFTATLQTAGNQSVSATDTTTSSITGNAAITMDAPPTLGPLTPAQATVGQSYTGTIAINNGTGPFTNLAVSGLTGTGLTATISGSSIIISGTPTAAGTFPLTFTVTDTAGVTTPVLNTSLVISAAAPTGRLRWVF